MQAPSQRLVGIALMAGAVFCFACLDATAKWLSHELPVLQVVWARYAANFLLVLPLINPWRTPSLMHSKRLGTQITRAALILVSTGLNVVALKYLQLAQTISIMFSTPFLVALLAGPFLGEWVGPRRAIAIAVGFAGVLIVTQPGMSGFHWAMLLSLAGAVIYAIGNIITRILSRHDPSTTTLFFVGAVGTAVTTPFVATVWVWPSSWFVWLMMVFIGAIAAIGHWFLILAHKYAPASIIAPFIYTQIIWMVSFGWIFFGDIPNLATLIGAAIVIASGVYLLWRERVVDGETRSAPEKA